VNWNEVRDTGEGKGYSRRTKKIREGKRMKMIKLVLNLKKEVSDLKKLVEVE